MKEEAILVFGAANFDHVYGLDRFVQPGESRFTNFYRREIGGKGLNQAIAAARAGAPVRFAGCIGRDGEALRLALESERIDTTDLRVVNGPSGHAIIQLTQNGENAIIVERGANHSVEPEHITEVLSRSTPGDWVIVQNEISGVSELLRQARNRSLRIVCNPTPLDASAESLPLHLSEVLIFNEGEAEKLSGVSSLPGVLTWWGRRCPETFVIVTLGSAGVIARTPGGEEFSLPAHRVRTVDTVGAGDTFVGFLTTALFYGKDFLAALEEANYASAISTTRPGAAASIPRRDAL
jgi:ribokinase